MTDRIVKLRQYVQFDFYTVWTYVNTLDKKS